MVTRIIEHIPAGAADTVSLRIGNRIVGNPEGAPALEVTLQGGRYEFETDATVALTGAEFTSPAIPMWQAVDVKKGAVIDLGSASRTYGATYAWRNRCSARLWGARPRTCSAASARFSSGEM